MKSLSDCNLQKVVAFPFLIVESLYDYGNIKKLILILRLSECMQNILFVFVLTGLLCSLYTHRFGNYVHELFRIN